MDTFPKTPVIDQAEKAGLDAVTAAAGSARFAQSTVETKAKPIIDRFMSKATEASAAAKVKGAQLKDAHAAAMNKSRAQVREQPAAAVGIAAAVGFLAGLLFRSLK